MIRRRYGSESENTAITTVIVEEKETFKDKILSTNTWSKLTNHFVPKSESFQQQQQYSGNNNFNQTTNFDSYREEEEPEIEFVMTARDRTVEFSNAIRSLQGRNITRAVNLRDPKKVKQMQSYSDFMMIAKTIGKNIASTYAKLEKLTLRKYYEP